MALWKRRHVEKTAAGTVEYTPSGQKVFRPTHHLRDTGKSPLSQKIDRFFANLNPATLFARRRGPSLPRTIYINSPLPAEFHDKKGRVLKDKVYPTNQNVTSKYTIITFLPRNLLEQFRRVANSE
jgi:phospholipid-translocating ATPase